MLVSWVGRRSWRRRLGLGVRERGGSLVERFVQMMITVSRLGPGLREGKDIGRAFVHPRLYMTLCTLME